ncbi:MAG: efflux RND transporter periplasmic adaptor subunit [Phocaeicola sp.]
MKTSYISIAILVLTTSCTTPKKEHLEEEKEIKQVTEQVEATKIDSIPIDGATFASSYAKEVTFNGVFVLSPQRHASITLSINGIVKSTSLLPGMYVRKGDLLATLENPEFISLQQEYLDASAQCDYLEAEYKRQEVLSKEEVASQKRYQQSKADYLSMKSRKDAASAQLILLGVSSQQLNANGIEPLLKVRASISGYISNLQMNLGKHIAAGTPLCDIIDKSHTLIKLTAYEKDLESVQVGNEISFSVNGMENKKFEGKIITIGQSVDNVNRSLEIFAEVMADNQLFRPGMYVNATIVRK